MEVRGWRVGWLLGRPPPPLSSGKQQQLYRSKLVSIIFLLFQRRAGVVCLWSDIRCLLSDQRRRSLVIGFRSGFSSQDIPESRVAEHTTSSG